MHQRVASQFQHADGSYAYDATYEDMRKKLNETIQSDMDMRKTNNTTYPREFYTQNGSLQRVVMDIPLDMQEESAMQNIDMIVAKYKDKGVDFSSAENAFIVKGQKVGPEKFFTSKISKLDGFLDKLAKDGTILDLNDDELFDILQKGDYKKFIELGKQRGMSRNKTNEALRAALKDEVVFHEICSEGVERSQLVNKMRNLSENFAKTAQLVSKESEKAVLGRVDRVMFSVVPEDLATQSTLQNWKSCMHTTGCNHRYVDDSIGLGSIVAYGYDSQNPQKSVSRLLIHPYYDENGNVAYKVNDRIYGKDNTGFRRAVESATQHFNKGSMSGVYSLPFELYDDNKFRSFTLLRSGDGILDLAQVQNVNGNITVDGSDLAQYKKIQIPQGADIIFKHVTLPENLDLSSANSVNFENLFVPENVVCPKDVSFRISTVSGDISRYGDAVFDSCIFENAHVPDSAKIEGIRVNFKNTDLPDIDYSRMRYIYIEGDCKIPDNFKAKHAKVTLTDMNLENIDLSDNEEILLEGRTKVGDNVKFPENVKFSQAILDYDISHLPNIEVNNCVLEKGVKFDPNTKFTGDVICKDADVLANLLKSDVDTIAILESMNLPKDFEKSNKVFMILNDNVQHGMLHETDLKYIIVANGTAKDAVIQQGFDYNRVKTYEEYNTQIHKPLTQDIVKDSETKVTGSAKENATTKSVASEGAELAADATVKTAAAKVATTATEKGAKSGVIETIKAVDDKVNTAIDKTIEKGSEKLNNTRVGKAYAKAEKAVANSTVGKAVNKGVKKVGSAVAKTVQKTGKAVAKTAAGKAVKKAAAKTAGKTAAKAVGKSLLKKIPVLSVGAGLVFGAQRAMAGDWKGAAGEVASGALGTFPGLGTAASVAIDAGLAGRDIYIMTLIRINTTMRQLLQIRHLQMSKIPPH